ncbi:MAG: ABC transporter permease subunit [Sulfurovum sp.]|nr:ABC transporter permease subunit [Sulfurovum sp.]
MLHKEIWRFRASVIPGLTISIALLSFAVLLFSLLYNFSDAAPISIIDDRIMGLVKFTLYQASISTVLSVSAGTVLAWSLTHQANFKGRSLLIALFSSSLVLPTLIVAFGMITILGNNGWLNRLSLYLFDYSFGGWLYGLAGILIAHVYLNASFASRGLLHSFESIPKEKYRLAKSLNFSAWQRFWLVEWVAIRVTIVSMAATIFLLCFTSFAIVLLLGGSPSNNTLEVAIYEAIKIDFDIPFALKLALIQLSISIMLVLLSSSFRVGSGNLKTSNSLITWREPKNRGLLQRAIIALSTIIFILPLIAIVADGIQADFIRIVTNPLFIRSLSISLAIATVSACLTVLFALLLSDARRNFILPFKISDSKFSKTLELMIAFSGNLYLAIPSLILGFGFFLISQRFEAPMIIWAMIAVLTANVLMSLPFALSIIYPAMQKTAYRYDKLTLSLGLSTLVRWRYCEIPYLRSSISYIFALSFALSLGDLGVIALFGSDEITTLPWYLYQLMGSYRNSDAAGVALILLVLVLGLFVIIPRIFAKGENAQYRKSDIQL